MGRKSSIWEIPDEAVYQIRRFVGRDLHYGPSRRCDGHPVHEAQPTRPLTAGEIAIAAGMSGRSLRRQFQRFTGQSPIAFHRNLRLEAARHALCDNHTKTDITTAAGMHGFSHLSHFTGQYRRRYGELPSATLRAVREIPCHCLRTPYPTQQV